MPRARPLAGFLPFGGFLARQITVLICTRNRAAMLRDTLKTLLSPANTDSFDWELLVVDNASTDRTAAVCRDFQKKFPQHVRSIVETKVGKSNALNAGIAAARGELLAFTDDDVYCNPDFLSQIRKLFAETAADAAQGRVLLDCEGGRPDWLDDTLALTAGFRDCGETVCELEGTLFGLNMIVMAEVFRKIGGFAPRLGPGQVGLSEDTELSFRMRQAGMRLIYAPNVIVHHRMPRSRLTRAFLRKRFFQEGRATAYRAAPPVSLLHFGLYVVKESVTREMHAMGHRRAKRPAMALREECEAFRQAGFFWQHLRMRFGILAHLSPTDAVTAR